MKRILFSLLLLFTVVACESEEHKLLKMKGQMEKQVRERATQYYTLEKYKDYKGMSQFVVPEDNFTAGGHTFKDSREYLISVYESGLMAPLESFEILNINADVNQKKAKVTAGIKYKRNMLEENSMDEKEWTYADGNWYFKIPRP